MNEVELVLGSAAVLFKWLLVVGVLAYVGYALIAIRQVNLMTASYNTPNENIVKWVARFNLGLALFVLVIVIVGL